MRSLRPPRPRHADASLRPCTGRGFAPLDARAGDRAPA